MALPYGFVLALAFPLVSTWKVVVAPAPPQPSPNLLVCADYTNSSGFMQCVATYVDVTNGHSWCVNASGYAVDLTAQARRGWCTNLARSGDPKNTVPVLAATQLTNDTATNEYMYRICGRKNAGYVNNVTLVGPLAGQAYCDVWNDHGFVRIQTPWPVVTVFCTYGENGSPLGCTYTDIKDGTGTFGVNLVAIFNPQFWRPFVNCELEMYRRYVFNMERQVNKATGFNCISGTFVGLPVGFALLANAGPGYLTIRYGKGGLVSAQFSASAAIECMGVWSTEEGAFIKSFTNIVQQPPSEPGNVYATSGSFQFCAQTGNIGSLFIDMMTQVY